MTDRVYEPGQREASTCQWCGSATWVVSHGPKRNCTVESRIVDAWHWYDRLRVADSGEWLEALAGLEKAGYDSAVEKGKWASHRDGVARLSGEGLPQIDVVFVGGEPWSIGLNPLDPKGNRAES